MIVGNKLTLETRPKERGLSTRDELLKFHNSFYSANIMALTVLGRGKQATYEICVGSRKNGTH